MSWTPPPGSPAKKLATPRVIDHRNFASSRLSVAPSPVVSVMDSTSNSRTSLGGNALNHLMTALSSKGRDRSSSFHLYGKLPSTPNVVQVIHDRYKPDVTGYGCYEIQGAFLFSLLDIFLCILLKSFLFSQ